MPIYKAHVSGSVAISTTKKGIQIDSIDASSTKNNRKSSTNILAAVTRE
jgi:hypothetical protein